MMTPLLRKLVHDVPALTDQTIVPLRVTKRIDEVNEYIENFRWFFFQMLTQWYERCSRYYSVAATEEEKRLTMMLFQKIFDALASRVTKNERKNRLSRCFFLRRLTIPNSLAKLCRVSPVIFLLFLFFVSKRSNWFSFQSHWQCVVTGLFIFV